MNHHRPRAIIIGAGPAGLTAGLELLRRTGIKPIILEASDQVGGISRTVRYRGNRMDIGGHRFFSKSDRVMQWWAELMPACAEENSVAADAARIHYHGQSREIAVTNGSKRSASASRTSSAGAAVAEWPEDPTGDDGADLVMLVRPRKSRIYFLRRFFDYPISLSRQTLTNLGLVRTIKIGLSYILAKLRPRKPEKTLEDFLINRFGRQLYLTFFKSYTEKVWGQPCHEISAEWGAQRIKGLSLTSAARHFLKELMRQKRKDKNDLAQKDVDTSLIERFLYPKLGPGQLWEHVADKICTGVQRHETFHAGEIHMGWRVVTVHCVGPRVEAVTVANERGERKTLRGEYFFSTMPIRELVQCMDIPVPASVRTVSDGLQYRDFITVGLLADRLKVKELDGSPLKDNWIYIQEPDVRLGRLQIFNNWSPHLVADPAKVWIGLEYFCNESDDLWRMSDDDLKRFAVEEVAKIGLLEADSVLDGTVVRVPKAYPAYFGTYDRLDEVREFTDSFENLFLIGRNGMHRYNNQDHSMLTAMEVVDGLVDGHVDKARLWSINTEQDYHERK